MKVVISPIYENFRLFGAKIPISFRKEFHFSDGSHTYFLDFKNKRLYKENEYLSDVILDLRRKITTFRKGFIGVATVGGDCIKITNEFLAGYTIDLNNGDLCLKIDSECFLEDEYHIKIAYDTRESDMVTLTGDKDKKLLLTLLGIIIYYLVFDVLDDEGSHV